MIALRIPGTNRHAICYEKGWDGNPYFVSGTMREHQMPARKARERARLIANVLGKRERETDPFFSLD